MTATARRVADITQVFERNQEATVYCGNLDTRVDEELLWELFVQCGIVKNVHIPRDKITGQHQSYGFVEFQQELDAEYAMKIMNMVKLYGKPIKCNKASQDKRTQEVGANLFIGNLDPDVDDKILHETFVSFGNILTAKVMRDPDNGESRGFGFVSFDGFEASDQALSAMNGQYICNKPIHVSYAYKKDTKGERHGTAAERLIASNKPKEAMKPSPMPPPLAILAQTGQVPPPPPGTLINQHALAASLAMASLSGGLMISQMADPLLMASSAMLNAAPPHSMPPTAPPPSILSGMPPSMLPYAHPSAPPLVPNAPSSAKLQPPIRPLPPASPPVHESSGAVASPPTNPNGGSVPPPISIPATQSSTVPEPPGEQGVGTGVSPPSIKTPSHPTADSSSGLPPHSAPLPPMFGIPGLPVPPQVPRMPMPPPFLFGLGMPPPGMPLPPPGAMPIGMPSHMPLPTAPKSVPLRPRAPPT